jgi:hypothetical protein
MRGIEGRLRLMHGLWIAASIGGAALVSGCDRGELVVGTDLLVLEGVTLIDGTDAAPRPGMSVVLEDGRIRAVGARRSFRFDEAATWQAPDVEVVAEGSWPLAGEDAPYEGGMFVSSAVRLGGPVWGVARAESSRPVDGLESWLGYAGVPVRASPSLVVKFGRQFSERPSARIPEGWFLSFSSPF